MKILKFTKLKTILEADFIKEWLMAIPKVALWPFAAGTRLEVTRHRIEVPGLAAALEGFRIVQLTDFHAAEFIQPKRLAAIIRRANAEDPDLIALTGDYLGFSPEYHTDSVKQICRLKARHGLFAVLGNHDLWEPHCARLVADFKRAGIEVLRNENRTLAVGTGSLCVMGLDDALTAHSDIDAATVGSHQADARILLAHHPDSLFALNGHAPHLVLTGHTHGGQIRLPLFGPATYFSKYAEQTGTGMHRKNGTYIYNSRGLGECMIPVRLRCRPELAVFTLARKPE